MPTLKPEPMDTAAAPAPGAVLRDVFRDYARTGSREGELEVDDNAQVNPSQDDPDLPPQGAFVQMWRYISNDEIAGFLESMVREEGLDESALDQSVHSAAERQTPTQAREEDLEILSMAASDVNNEGVSAQIGYLMAHLGPQGAYEAVLAAIQEASLELERPTVPIDGPRG